MKKILSFLCLALFAIAAFSQAPKSIYYQAVARDNAGKVLANKSISLRLSILDGSSTGSSIYTETHSVATNAFGLFALAIGNGAVVSGTFSTINWGGSSKFLRTEMDATGGTSYSVVGTSQFLSVPYALYAEKSGSSGNTLKAGNGINISGDSIHNTAQDKVVTLTGAGATNVTGTYPNFTITSTDTKGDADSSATNELQNLSIIGRQLSISKGNSVYVPSDADSSATNELQTISRTNGTITLSNGGGSIALPDSSATNELQSLNINGGRISLSNGGGTIKLPDSSSTDELQILTRKGDTLFLSNGGKVILPDSNEWVKNGTSISYNKGNVGIGTTAPNEKLSVAGKIESTTGGFKFPDSTMQKTAAHTYYAGKGILLKNDTFSLDTNYVLQNLAFNPEYPDGLNGIQTVVHDLALSDYLVPTGKNLHIQSVNGTDTIMIDSIKIQKGHSVMIIKAGSKISMIKKSSTPIGGLRGYLSPNNVTPVFIKLTTTSFTYTVPAGKTFYWLSAWDATPKINGIEEDLIPFTQGTKIIITGYGTGWFNGFLR